MINLLPPVYADAIRYGRMNAVLRRWLFAILFSIGGLAAIISFGWLYIEQQTKSLQTGINSSKQQLDAQDLEKVKKDADEISSDIRIINQVLSQEIRFSGLIQDIGKIMPSGTVLGSITLTKVNGAIDLSTNAKDYASAAQIAVNLNDPANNLFDKVDIVNINCAPTTIIGDYKCAATFRALFNKSAASRYLNVAKEGSP